MECDHRALLRRQLRQARQKLNHEQQKQAAIALATYLPDHSLVQHASQIAIYIANDGELDPHLLAEVLHARGKQLALPVMHPFSPNQLLFQRYQPGQSLRTNRFQIPEPALAKPDIVPLQELDLVLMPLVGFDGEGHRLGMGGGFYDRTLGGFTTTQRPQLLGLAHSVQEVAQLPNEAWDVPLDAVATEQGLRRFRT
ncbi:5-formyltetrahydrofolate cyclo-ligase [Ferrimonas marina]|uniref:5-formyltetrahydrofolate cyclo-ligase n=1 Tax=Ferrimonas marina TaxID=299255 RepID=A0A1M5ZG19_9GAMM|nr:5-formyltetrahydrofolate cyclo-ligase [Ferrimonas marina]SHI22843.1 5-formyltetrahydrofolate cyclo-ligase [Ferrimonas marina]